MPKTKMPKPKNTRYSISVTSATYERLRAAVPPGGLASCVDEIVKAALDDPPTLARLVARCRGEEAYS